MVYPNMKLNILFNSKGLAILSGFTDITHNKKMILAAMTLFLSEFRPISNSSELLVKWIYGINFRAIHKKMV